MNHGVAVARTDQEIGEATMRKVACRLIPFLGALYFFAFLDRVNVGFAALTMNADLGLSAAAFGIGAGIFFIGYIAFEVPSNIMLERFGPRLWIARIMISWGLLSAAMAFVRGPNSFYAVRLLLGIAEAGFFPGIIYYLTCWFPEGQRARIIGMFMIALPLSSVIGAPISTALLEVRAAGLNGWQWMFLAEALPTIVLGILVLFLLPNRPADAKWLTSAEKEWLADGLARERDVSPGGRPLSLRQVFATSEMWKLGLVYFCMLIGLYGFGFWLPQIVGSLGNRSSLQVGFMTMVPYSCACIALVLWGRHSDHAQERALHVAAPLLLAATALAAGAWIHQPTLQFIALCVTAIGIYSGLPCFWAMAGRGMQGAAAAGAIALVNSLGNFGGFLGPVAIGISKQRSGDYVTSFLLIAALLVLGAGLAALGRTRESEVNTRPAAGVKQKLNSAEYLSTRD